MKLLAVGVETWTDSSWMSDVGPVPSSITKPETAAAWMVKTRLSRENDGFKSAWMGRIKRLVFADATDHFATEPLKILFDTRTAAESPAIAAYKWLLEEAGAEVTTTHGCTSHVMFGWQFRKSIRAWAGDLMVHILCGNLALAGKEPLPLRFWHRPPHARSVRDIFLPTTETAWVSDEDMSRLLGLEGNIATADCNGQLEYLRKLANIADYTKEYVSSPPGYYEEPYQYQ